MTCGSCARQEMKSGERAWITVRAPKDRDRFLTSRVGREAGDNRRVGTVFHFSEAPTVTAGFIGFAFDIRIVIEVARHVSDVSGRRTYAGGSRRCRGDDGNHGQQVRIAARTDGHAGRGRAQDHDSNPFQLFIRGRGRPPVAYRDRPGSEPAHLVQRQSEKRRLVHDPGAQTSRLREAAARRRHHDQAAGESLGQHSLRPLQYEDGGHGEVEFPQPAGVSDGGSDHDSGPGVARTDCADGIRDLERRVALHAEWRADAAEAGVDHDGGDRRTSAGALRAGWRESSKAFPAR